MHLGLANNVAARSFPLRRTKKLFLIFRVTQTGCFVKKKHQMKVSQLYQPIFQKY
jgi:hypothetical protein